MANEPVPADFPADPSFEATVTRLRDQGCRCVLMLTLTGVQPVNIDITCTIHNTPKLPGDLDAPEG